MARKHNHTIVLRSDDYVAPSKRQQFPPMQNQITTNHFIVVGVAKINQHRNQAAAVVKVYAARVADVTLVYVHADPQFVRVVLDLADVTRLLVLAGFSIRDVPSLA